MLDVRFPVHLFVVMPNPPGQSLEQEAHVILVQRPNPLWRAALLTVTHPREDPWHMQFLCVMLDVETSLEQLAFISGVTHPSNPDALECAFRPPMDKPRSRMIQHSQLGMGFGLISMLIVWKTHGMMRLRRSSLD
jgi:hypothetical protein